jgi:hypothetical protein
MCADIAHPKVLKLKNERTAHQQLIAAAAAAVEQLHSASMTQHYRALGTHALS